MNKKENKNPLQQDPYAQREATKYTNPVPSRELILSLLKTIAKPIGKREILKTLNITDEEKCEAIRRRLKAMERDGQLLRNRRNCYCIINSKDLLVGRVLGHADGFGFLMPDDGSDDLFLSPREMKALMPNDRVVAHISGIDRRGRREGNIVEILERNTHQVVGRYQHVKSFGFVVPDNPKINKDILIAQEYNADAKHGQIVVAQLLKQPNKRSQPMGKISEILGDPMESGMEIEMALRSYELPYHWPEQVKQEISTLANEVSLADKQERVDLRNTPLVTIDGEDARDFDDAVFCKKTTEGWQLLVAIADVAHYVTVNSPLDIEAHNRGTSVYFPERVIPMLPEILANGLCSLNADADRLCMVCEINFSKEGKFIKAHFFEAIMRSHARLTYTEVEQILVANNQKMQKKYAKLLPHLQQLYALYKLLSVIRSQRGAMDFDSQETRIVFGKNRKIEKIVPCVRNDAHRLIEEFMIAANIAAAQFLRVKKMPLLLRIHDGPTAEKVIDLRTFLSKLGLHLSGGVKPNPADYMNVVEQIKGRDDAHLIQTVLLRSLSQAVYSPDQKNHFGLALDAYTHFTSPIRRYPDLLVHRAIRHCLQNKTPDTFTYSMADMVLLGEHCSAHERRADEATRNVITWLKCEFMLDKIGEEFTGIISTVTGFGFFVDLSDVYVEGLVHISSLGQDYFHFDPISHQLQGERTSIKYRLGDRVQVVVVRVNLDEKKIDFNLQSNSKQIRKKSKN